MSSELRVDKIVPVDGVSSGGGGGIIQVKYTYKKNERISFLKQRNKNYIFRPYK